MLLAADYAYAPESLAEVLQAQQQKQLIPDKQLVSEAVLQAASFCRISIPVLAPFLLLSVCNDTSLF